MNCSCVLFVLRWCLAATAAGAQHFPTQCAVCTAVVHSKNLKRKKKTGVACPEVPLESPLWSEATGCKAYSNYCYSYMVWQHLSTTLEARPPLQVSSRLSWQRNQLAAVWIVCWATAKWCLCACVVVWGCGHVKRMYTSFGGLPYAKLPPFLGLLGPLQLQAVVVC
jgi:hypothetical protein